MSIKVSVVVPVSDPDAFTHDCVQTLLGQTMAREDFEILLVRDDVPAGTVAQTTWLEALERSHSHVHIISVDRATTTGDLRAIGIAAARGEYVQVVEAHERPAPTALRRLYHLAQRGRSDIVLGKVASPYRQTLPLGLRRGNDSVATADPAVWESLTPYALFRTAFLTENGITESIGDGPLDRELVTVRTLLTAKFIATLADGICSYDVARPGERNRPDGTGAPAAHASTAWLDPARHYLGLRKLVEYIGRHTEPGALRDNALARVYRTQVLRDLREPHLLTWSQQVRDGLFTHACALADDGLFEPVHAQLPLLERLASTLIRRGRLDDLIELSRRNAAIRAMARVERTGWKNGRLEVSLSAQLARTGDDGAEPAPIGLIRHSGRDFVDPAPLAGLADDGDTEVTKELRGYRAEVLLHHRESGARWAVPAGLELVVEHLDSDDRGTRCRLSFRGTAIFDPERMAGRRPLDPGTWDVRLRIDALGLVRETCLVATNPAETTRDLLPAVYGKSARVLVPYLNSDGAMIIDADRAVMTLAAALAGREVVPQPGNGRRLDLDLPAVGHPGSGQLDAVVALRGTDEHSTEVGLPARLVTIGPRVRLTADVGPDAPGPVRSVRPGTWQLWGRLDGEHDAEVALGSVHVDPRSRMYLVGADRIGPLGDWSRRFLAATARRPRLRRLGSRAIDLLPEQWQRGIRLAIRRARG